MSQELEESYTKFHKRWGEFDDEPEEPDIGTVDISLEELNSLIQEAMQPDALKRLQCKDESDEDTEEYEVQIGCPRVLNTIDMQQYLFKLGDIEDEVQQRVGKLMTVDVEQVPPVPDPPKEVDPKYKPNCLNFIHPFESDFINGISKPAPELDRKSTWKLLRRCVLLMLAQIGFVDVTQNTLDTFIAAVDEFYKNLTKIIHSKMDAALVGYDTQFCDIYEHSLQDIGTGGIRGLQQYYKRFVSEYETTIYKKCLKVRQDLITLIETPQRNTITGTRRRRKQSLDETVDYDYVHTSYESYPSTSGNVRAEVPVLHLPEDGSSYVDANLYELLPDIEITDEVEHVDEVAVSVASESGAGASNTRGGLMSMEIASERGHAEDSTTGYFDVEDLANF